MKTIRIFFHILLTAMVGLFLPSCRSQKAAVEKPETEVRGEEPMICLYGIPPALLEKQQGDTTSRS